MRSKFLLYLFGFFLCSLFLCWFIIEQVSPLNRIQELEDKVKTLESVVTISGVVLDQQEKEIDKLLDLVGDTVIVLKESGIIDKRRSRVLLAGKCTNNSCSKYTGMGGP